MFYPWVPYGYSSAANVATPLQGYTFNVSPQTMMPHYVPPPVPQTPTSHYVPPPVAPQTPSPILIPPPPHTSTPILVPPPPPHTPTPILIPPPPPHTPTPILIPPPPSQIFIPPPGPNRYTLEEITPLIRTIVHEIMNVEATTLTFEDDDDDDDEPAVDLQDLRVYTVVTVLQAIPEQHSLCAVCHDDYKVSDVVRKLRCNHMFHMICIDQALEDSAICPMCRMSIVPDESTCDEDDVDD